MHIVLAVALLLAGLGLVVFFAEKLVKGVVGTSIGFGVSAFLISVVFIGFDPENLIVGAVASREGVAGIALGTIVGSAMVATALAFGVTAVIAPMRFKQAPRRVLLAPVAAVLLLGALASDGLLSRIDGAILLTGFALSVLYLVRLSRMGLDIEPSGEVAETLEDADGLSRWKSLGLMLASIAALVVGSVMLVRGAEVVIGRLGLSDTVFGMTILALLVSVEELARELPAARKGRGEIAFGNVAGSILAFFLFNAGIIAVVRPVPVTGLTLSFYLPYCAATVLLLALVMATRRVSRLAGVVLVLLYLGFVVPGYLI